MIVVGQQWTLLSGNGQPARDYEIESVDDLGNVTLRNVDTGKRAYVTTSWMQTPKSIGRWLRVDADEEGDPS